MYTSASPSPSNSPIFRFVKWFLHQVGEWIVPVFIAFIILVALGTCSPKTADKVAKPDAATLFAQAQETGGKALKALPKRLLEMGKHGDAEALNFLGGCYELGLGVEQDNAKALEFFKDAALKGSMPAAFNAGMFLENGIGTEPDTFSAIPYLEMAAYQGYVNAQSALVKILTRGDNPDVSEAADHALSLLATAFADKPACLDLVNRAVADEEDARINLALFLFFDSDSNNEIIHAVPALQNDAITAQKIAMALLMDVVERRKLTLLDKRIVATCYTNTISLASIGNEFDDFANAKPLATIHDLYEECFRRFGPCWSALNPGGWCLLGFDPENVVKAYEGAVERTGDKELAAILANFLENHDFMPANPVRELRWRRLCDDAHSEFRLGCLYASAPGNCLLAPNGFVAARHFANCDDLSGEDAFSARNALLCMALHGLPIPGSLDDIARRQEEAMEETSDAVFAPLLLAVKSLRDGNVENARKWVAIAAENGGEEAGAMLRDWDAIFAEPSDDDTPFVRAARLFLGVGGTVDWHGAVEVAIPAVGKGDADADALAESLLDCNWWDGYSRERMRQVVMDAAKAGLRKASFWMAWDVLTSSGFWNVDASSVDRAMAWLADDDKWFPERAADIAARARSKTAEATAQPPTMENLMQIGSAVHGVPDEMTAFVTQLNETLNPPSSKQDGAADEPSGKLGDTAEMGSTPEEVEEDSHE